MKSTKSCSQNLKFGVAPALLLATALTGRLLLRNSRSEVPCALHEKLQSSLQRNPKNEREFWPDPATRKTPGQQLFSLSFCYYSIDIVLDYTVLLHCIKYLFILLITEELCDNQTVLWHFLGHCQPTSSRTSRLSRPLHWLRWPQLAFDDCTQCLTHRQARWQTKICDWWMAQDIFPSYKFGALISDEILSKRGDHAAHMRRAN